MILRATKVALFYYKIIFIYYYGYYRIVNSYYPTCVI